MKLLEVLVPTYGRSESAAAAIESILACKDDRISVRCNSNGYDPILEKYRAHDGRVLYDCFYENQGMHKNLKHLYSTTDAKFCMLLSDEDRLNQRGVVEFLDFLEELDSEIYAVTCAVYDTELSKYYHMPSKWLPSSVVDLNEFVIFSPVSSYISGLVFQSSKLQELDLDSLLTASSANAYSHLDITFNLLKSGYLSIYRKRFVEKGPDVKYGGEGYSHKISEENNTPEDKQNLNLNFHVYGPKARALQFYHVDNLLNNNKEHLSCLAYFKGKVDALASYAYAVCNSDRVVLMPANAKTLIEARKGFAEFFFLSAAKSSAAAKYFFVSCYLPSWAFRLNSFFLNIFNKYLTSILCRLYFYARFSSASASKGKFK